MWRAILLSFSLVLSSSASANAEINSPSQRFHGSQEHTLDVFSASPLTFTENQGQWNTRVRFRAETGNATMWITSTGVCYQFVRPQPKADQLVVRATVVGANPFPNIVGEKATSHKYHYFIDDDSSQWRNNVPSYGEVVFKDIYDGIDLKYYFSGTCMEYDFVVSPDADVAQIAIRYDGTEPLSVSKTGELVVETAWGTMTEMVPVVYQTEGDQTNRISATFRLMSDNVFGFELGDDYNPALAVVIDPVLSFSTYLGGSGDDEGRAITVDAERNIYVTGSTTSADFPTESPIHGRQALKDAFISKFDRWGDLVYSTYLGGGGDDTGRGIAVDAYGYVYGSTASEYFPTVNPYKDGPLTCDGDAFVSKLSPTGDALIFSTYLGGNSADWGIGIGVDELGYVYVGGMAQSSDFPTVNPYQTFQGVRDAFVTKFHPAGNSLVYSTCLGGSDIDGTWGVALGNDGSVYITGQTKSPDYPTANAYQTDQGNDDAFLTRLNASGDNVIYSTYLGGGLMDVGTSVAVDDTGNAYVTGWTQSFDFPLLNQYQSNRNYDDVFVTKFNSSGSVVYSTYLGGSSYDIGWGIDVDAMGHAYVTGWTRSADFPTLDPIQGYQDTTDVFLTGLNPAGNGLVFSSYLGGNGDDWAWGLALDAFGNPYITGRTRSTDFPTDHPYQAYQNEADVFVAGIWGHPVSVEDQTDPYPERFLLHQNVPNPFNPTTLIRYEVPPEGGRVLLSIYDVEGRLVHTLVDGVESPGIKFASWDGRNTAGQRVASGVYFYRLTAENFEQTLKMTLLE
jgi:hypothetical protein